MSFNVRLAFHKTGRARYISHLDLMAAFQRAFYKAELNLKYSQGFNPHAYISAALPLSVGQASLAERLDFGVDGEIDLPGLPKTLNPLLPNGIHVTDAVIAQRPYIEIAYAGYELTIKTLKPIEDFTRLFNAPIVVKKKTKKGIADTDILPMVKSYNFSQIDNETLKCIIEVTAQNPTLNVEYLTDVFVERVDPSAKTSILRTRIFDKDGSIFDTLNQEF